MVLIVQDDAVPRMKMLAAEMDWDIRLARGCIDELWSNSQAAGVSQASGRVIAGFCSEPDRSLHAALLEALSAAHIRFLKKVGPDVYEIAGNEKVIKKVGRVREANTLNAEARWAKERARKMAEIAKLDDEAMRMASERQSKRDANRMRMASESQCDPYAKSMPKLNQAKLNQAELNCNTETTTTARDPVVVADGDEEDFRGLTPLGLVALWNELRGSLAKAPKTIEMHEVVAALDENPDPEYWRGVFEDAAASPFLTGKVPTDKSPHGFRASLPWVLEHHGRIAGGEFPAEAVAAAPAPACPICLDTGTVTASSPDGVAESFRCGCAAGEDSPRQDPVPDGWKRWEKQIDDDRRFP